MKTSIHKPLEAGARLPSWVSPMESSVDQFRTALKFSLWAWALYWPGGGLILMAGGLDPISIAVTVGCVLVFIAMLAGGALRTTSSRNVRELFLERPLYLVAGLVFFIAFSSLLPALDNAGLLLFSAVWTYALGLVAYRFREHLRQEGLTVWASKADQVFIVLALAGIASLAVLLDAVLGLGNASLGTAAPVVAVFSWLSLLYPPMMLVATRPFREPLTFRREAKPVEQVVPNVLVAPLEA
jgi:hypothetical protein